MTLLFVCLFCGSSSKKVETAYNCMQTISSFQEQMILMSIWFQEPFGVHGPCDFDKHLIQEPCEFMEHVNVMDHVISRTLLFQEPCYSMDQMIWISIWFKNHVNSRNMLFHGPCDFKNHVVSCSKLFQEPCYSMDQMIWISMWFKNHVISRIFEYHVNFIDFEDQDHATLRTMWIRGSRDVDEHVSLRIMSFQEPCDFENKVF